MNTITTNASTRLAPRASSPSLWQLIVTELRRGLEFAGAAYASGRIPPM
jgi:hypothetical protein